MTDFEKARPNHCKILDELDAGIQDPMQIVEALLRWMPDEEIKDCLEVNELWFDDEEDEVE